MGGRVGDGRTAALLAVGARPSPISASKTVAPGGTIRQDEPTIDGTLHHSFAAQDQLRNRLLAEIESHPVDTVALGAVTGE